MAHVRGVQRVVGLGGEVDKLLRRLEDALELRQRRLPHVVPVDRHHLPTEQSRNISRVGMCLDFASSPTRTPHGACMRMSG